MGKKQISCLKKKDLYFSIIFLYFKENKLGSGQLRIFFDGKGCSLAHCKSITPMVVKQILAFTESAIPIRVKSANCYNMPSFLEHLFNLFKIFAKNKLANRVNSTNLALKKTFSDFLKSLFRLIYTVE